MKTRPPRRSRQGWNRADPLLRATAIGPNARTSPFGSLKVYTQSGRGRDGADFGSGQGARSGAMRLHRDRRATPPWAQIGPPL